MELLIGFLTDPNNIFKIINTVLGVGIIWTVIAVGNDLIKEINDVLVTYIEAMEDKKITEDEFVKLKKEIGDVVKSVKSIVKKNK